MKSVHLLRNVAATARARPRNLRGLGSQSNLATIRRRALCNTQNYYGFYSQILVDNQHFNRTFSSSLETSLSRDNVPLCFEDLDIHPKSLKALQRHGFQTMTEIQEKTFSAASNGQDVLGRARTGTGKTLSFLLPGLERTLRNPIPGQVNMLILSPTRELAAQIQAQSQMLVSAHNNSITSQVIYGGASKREDIRRFEKNIPTILVATPGRLNDHIASTVVNGTPFVERIQQLQVLVLDEMDRLLDLGFRREIEQILRSLPQQRQTLLFSATLPPDVRSVLKMATKKDFLTVDCIQDEDPTTHTNAMTEQSHVILPPSRFLSGTVEILLSLIDDPKNKVMCFFPMTSLVQLYSTLFSNQFGRRVLELHGKMDQRSRSRISQKFRNSKTGTLFTSDVSARGVDYPDVTHVVMFGACNSRETYIHRLGRTGRAGKKGKGLLILPDIERHFLDDLDGLDIRVNKEWQTRMDGPASKQVMNELGPISQDVKSGRAQKLAEAASDSYHAMVSYYLQRSIQGPERSRQKRVVNTINGMVSDIGLPELPGIPLKRARMLGINNVPGLNIEYGWDDKSDWTSGSWVTPSSDRSDIYSRGPGMSRSRSPHRRFGASNHHENGNLSSVRLDNKRQSTTKPSVERQRRRNSRERGGQKWKRDALGLDDRNDSKYGYTGRDTSKTHSFKRWESPVNSLP